VSKKGASRGAKKRAARKPAERHERQHDPRLAAVLARSQDGEALPPGTWMVRVSPVARKGEPELQWHPPQPVAFSLVEAKKLARRAAKRRRSIMGSLIGRSNGTLQPANTREALDVIADLRSAVLHSFAAIEAMANAMIDRLPPETIVQVGKPKDARPVAQPDLIWLKIEEKLRYVVPICEGGVDVVERDDNAWRGFKELEKLRDALVHTKEDGYDPDPDVRTAYDQLILGDGDDCWRQALDLVQAAWPGFLGELALSYLND
jgi:hypothetical protein